MSEVWIASMVALWVVAIILAFLLMGALRQIGLMQLRLGDDPGALITDDGLSIGSRAPAFEAIDSQTGSLVRSEERPARARLMTFITPSCVACRALIPHLNEVFRTRNHEFDFLVICQGDEAVCASFQRAYAIDPDMVIDSNGDVAAKFRVSATPFTYLLDYEGTVLIRGIANDWTQLESLLDQEGTPQAGKALTPVGV